MAIEPVPSHPRPPDDLALLVPVWHGYRRIAPLTRHLIDRFWPAHPPLWFCGLTPAEAGDLPTIPWTGGADRSNWTRMLVSGVAALRERGFRLTYLVLEEHVPLAPCHVGHLNHTLPRLMDELPAVYLSLMGWDNRRHPTRQPRVGPDRFARLDGPRAPRFHLHPALWDLATLESCCEVALADPAANGSAWHFERANARDTKTHSAERRARCYQICAERFALQPPGSLRSGLRAFGRAIHRKLMALYPLLPPKSLGRAYAALLRLDDVFCEGPYPMFFSGLLAKGTLNPHLRRFLARRPDGADWLELIRRHLPEPADAP